MAGERSLDLREADLATKLTMWEDAKKRGQKQET
jgi:hypothetical protein